MQMLVAGWRALGMVGRGQFVGIMGFASMDWLVSDIATTYMGGVMAPLPTNILVEDIKHLVLEAEVCSRGVAMQEVDCVMACIVAVPTCLPMQATLPHPQASDILKPDMLLEWLQRLAAALGPLCPQSLCGAWRLSRALHPKLHQPIVSVGEWLR